MTWYKGRIEALTGDITTVQADAVVNAANSSLLGGGGVDGAVHRAGGPEILAECRRLRETTLKDGLPTGRAVITGAGSLPCRYVIHTVGPVWSGGGRGEENLLADAYRNSLEQAASIGVRTLCFPAISTGVYRFPGDKAARIAWRTFSAWLPGNPLPEKIILVFFSAPALAEFTANIPEPEHP